ncbi:putative nucleic acid-binding protein [Salinibacter ruber]|jgi:predicted nucleic acid-binding protein|uniref:PIN domain-containing protein n=1 Tax=Salinibacter ruber TaxID=146919 RepID=UPI0021676F07|nr:PIN domain-containing protein [Salinibacter ruber]MCS4177354.1 putative nucleic acid-binding protein [Salinibacter ruber]
MTAVFDTNVLLDVLLDRTHAEDGLFLLDQSRHGEVAGAVTPTVLTNTYYVGRRTAGSGVPGDFIESALSFLDVASVSHAGAVRAVKRYEDFEDGIIGEAAAEYGADVICTRNEEDFGPARPQVLTPSELAELLKV